MYGVCHAAIVGGSPALANGGDFFEELNASWGQQNTDDGVPYFGFANRDSKGKTIPSASITATTASGSSFVVQADNYEGITAFRSFSKSVDPKRVQITSGAARRATDSSRETAGCCGARRMGPSRQTAFSRPTREQAFAAVASSVTMRPAGSRG